jgi:hypothetical protein
MADSNEDYGPCCVCCCQENVRNIWMLNLKGPHNGWGCFVCHLPAQGAIAIICDLCAERDYTLRVDDLVAILDGQTKAGRAPLPAINDRIPFLHDLRHHLDEAESVHWFDLSPDATSPLCVCSLCGKDFQDPDEHEDWQNPMRLFDREKDVEARFHQACFEFAQNHHLLTIPKEG